VAIHEDQNPIVHTYDKVVDLSRTLLSSTTDGADHTLKSFFARPKKILDGTWSTSATQGQVLTSINVPFDMLNFDVMTDKLRGFLGFRGKAIIRLVANATRFQQGRLLLNFFPQNDVNVARHDMTNFTSWGSASIIYATQLPRVDFDPSNDTDVMLEVPYITDNLYFNLVSGEGSAGIANLIVYSPLIDPTGTGQVNWTIFVHFEDVELEYATYPSSLFTQAGPGAKGGTRSKKTTNRKPPDEVEATKAKTGPVSSVLGTVADIATALVDVPILSSIAAPVSWVAGALRDVAAFFGFSKPQNIHAVQFVNNNPHRNAVNSTGTDNSYNLGLFEDNKVQHLPGFAGTDVDEMSINHIIAIPAFYTSFNWAASATAGTSISTIPCDPSLYFQTTSAQTVNGTTGQTGVHCIPLTYISQMFAKYRGSIRFTYKLVKTEFHSGRLLVVFGAGTQNTADINFTNTAYTHREILDIRESTEFTFVCPYASTRPYHDIPSGIGGSADPHTTYGYISVYVLNPLVAPPTVSQTVTMLVEVSAAEDFEFAIPSMLRTMPYMLNFPSISPYPGPAPGVPPVITQAGDTVDGTVTASVHEQKTYKPIGSSSLVQDHHDSAALCIGEKIVSLRHLLKRSLASFAFNSTATSMCIVPNIPLAMTPGVPGTNFWHYFDYYDFIAPLYGLFRGSVVIKRLYTPHVTDVRTTAYVSMYQRPIQAGDSQYIRYTNIDCYGNAITQAVVPLSDEMNEFPEYSIPYYSDRHVSVNTIATNAQTQVSSYHRPTTVLGVMTRYPTTPEYDDVYSRSVGEDFSFGYFLSTVPLFYIQTVSQPAPLTSSAFNLL
jgi:hypothetical protein